MGGWRTEDVKGHLSFQPLANAVCIALAYVDTVSSPSHPPPLFVTNDSSLRFKEDVLIASLLFFHATRHSQMKIRRDQDFRDERQDEGFPARRGKRATFKSALTLILERVALCPLDQNFAL